MDNNGTEDIVDLHDIAITSSIATNSEGAKSF